MAAREMGDGDDGDGDDDGPPNVGMTVGELRRALEGVSDDIWVTVRGSQASGEPAEDFCGGVVSAATEDNCGGRHFAIDCSDAGIEDEIWNATRRSKR